MRLQGKVKKDGGRSGRKATEKVEEMASNSQQGWSTCKESKSKRTTSLILDHKYIIEMKILFSKKY